MSKLIITAAITGAVHTPSLSPYFPYTEDQIVSQAVDAAKAGAAVVHIHARDEEGRPDSDPEKFRKILSRIHAQCDAVICMTTGGSVLQTVEERVRPLGILKPELASLNSGSMNFSYHMLAKKLDNAKFAWEKDYVLSTENAVFSNTFRGLRIYGEAMRNAGTVAEIEIYDVGQINNVRYCLDEGILKGKVYFQFVMGVLGGIPATADNLVFLVETARRQIGEENFVWSCAATGKSQFPMTTMAATMGGNVRVGLEDNLFIAPGEFAKSSAQQVESISKIIHELRHDIASPDEARAILGLKGRDKVGFV